MLLLAFSSKHAVLMYSLTELLAYSCRPLSMVIFRHLKHLVRVREKSYLRISEAGWVWVEVEHDSVFGPW